MAGARTGDSSPRSRRHGRCDKLESHGPSLNATCRRWRVAALCRSSLVAQQPSPPQRPTFKAGTQVVSLFATVADAQKRLVPGLTQEDFEVFDNDKPQPIVFFENEVQPITVVVMLDTSGSMTLTLDLLSRRREQFLIRLLPADKARVGAFNDKIQFSSRVHQQSRSADHRCEGSRLRQRHAAVGRGRREPRRAEGNRGTAGHSRVHRRRRHGEPDEPRHGDRSRARRRSDDLRDRLESNYFNGQRMVRSKPDRGLRKVADETGGGYFELTKTASSRRPSPASRRSSTAST